MSLPEAWREHIERIVDFDRAFHATLSTGMPPPNITALNPTDDEGDVIFNEPSESSRNRLYEQTYRYAIFPMGYYEPMEPPPGCRWSAAGPWFE